MHIRSEKVQNLKMSTSTQSPISVLKVNISAEEDEYQYLKSSIDTQG